MNYPVSLLRGSSFYAETFTGSPSKASDCELSGHTCSSNNTKVARGRGHTDVSVITLFVGHTFGVNFALDDLVSQFTLDGASAGERLGAAGTLQIAVGVVFDDEFLETLDQTARAPFVVFVEQGLAFGAVDRDRAQFFAHALGCVGLGQLPVHTL